MAISAKPTLVIVVPCYNEEDALPQTLAELSRKISRLVSDGLISQNSALLFVDDGSKDNTWKLIKEFHGENSGLVKGIKLSENRGHQNALLCGLLNAKNHADVVISIDADLQDDVEAIDQMLKAHLLGAEIVCAVRSNREGDGFFKKTSARCFYSLMRLLGSGIIRDHADFRLMGRKSLEALSQCNEANLFLRGLILKLGYETSIVYYDRKKRLHGKSKYSFRKMLGLAFNGLAGEYIGKIARSKPRPHYHIEEILFD